MKTLLARVADDDEARRRDRQHGGYVSGKTRRTKATKAAKALVSAIKTIQQRKPGLSDVAALKIHLQQKNPKHWATLTDTERAYAVAAAQQRLIRAKKRTDTK